MIYFLLDLIKLFAVFLLSVYSLEALVVLGVFIYWYVQYRREARRGP